jgi:hypothetical protein
MTTQCNSLSKLITKHFLECIDPKEVACKKLTNQSWTTVGTSVGEAIRARTVSGGNEAADGVRGGKELCEDTTQEVTG